MTVSSILFFPFLVALAKQFILIKLKFLSVLVVLVMIILTELVMLQTFLHRPEAHCFVLRIHHDAAAIVKFLPLT